MNENKVVRIPISFEKRQKNKHDKGYVPCQVSGRYLQFNLDSVNPVNIIADVMTENTDGGKDRKLCEMVFNISDLKEVMVEISKRM